MQTGLEDRVKDQVGIGVRADGTNFHARRLRVADRNSNHRAAIHGGSFDLVRRFKMRVEAAISIHTRVEQETNVIAVREDLVHETPTKLGSLLLALRIPEKIFASLGDRNVCVHTRTVNARDRLWKEAGRHAHLRGHLATNQLVQLNLIGGRNDIAIRVVDLELRRSDFRMVFLVLETHGTLHFGSGVDELTERVTRERMIVSALVDVLELASLMVGALGVDTIKEEALDLIRSVQRIAIPGKLLIGEILQDSTDVARVVGAIFVNYFAKYENLARTKNVGWGPIKSAPIKSQAKIALPLRREAANGRPVECEIIVTLDQKLLVVVEHMEA